MKRFRFPLEGVLSAKAKQEDAAKTELGRRRAALGRIEALIERLARQRRTHDARFHECLDQGAEPSTAVAMCRYAAELTGQIEQTRREAEAAQREVDEQLEQVVALSVERKSFETLRERRLESHRRDAQREQYNRIDDMILSRREDPNRE